MTKLLSKLLVAENLPLLMFFFYILWRHQSFDFSGDDLAYAEYDIGRLGPDFLFMRYSLFNVRTLTEILEITLANLPVSVWRTLDSFMFLLLCGTLSYLTVPNNMRFLGNAAIAVLFVLFPPENLSNAGWMATTLNYLWPSAFLLVALVPLKKMARNERISFGTTLVCLAAMILAEDLELFLMAFVLIFGGMLLYVGIKRRYVFFLAAQFFFTVLMSLKIILSPSVDFRYNLAAALFFPDFDRLSLLDKMMLETSSLAAYFFYCEYVTFALGIMLLFMVCRKTRSFFCRLAAFLPLLIQSVAIAWPMLTMNVSDFSSLLVTVGIKHDITALNFDSFASWMPFVLSAMFFFFTFLSIYMAFVGEKNFYPVMLVFVTGFLSGMVLGLSPTMFASNIRAFFPFELALIAIGVQCVLTINDNEHFL